MSERMNHTLELLIVAGLGLIGTAFANQFGVEHGRAEMKRWQDSYYAGEKRFDEAECAKQRINDFLLGERAIVAPTPPKKAKPAKAISAHEALSPILNMLDVETTKRLTKFYVTIPLVEGHWEIMATDRVNAILRLGSTSWTESEWKNCWTCQESKTVESIAIERWKKLKLACPDMVFDGVTGECEHPTQSSDIDPQGAVCVAGSSEFHPTERTCPQIVWPAAKP